SPQRFKSSSAREPHAALAKTKKKKDASKRRMSRHANAHFAMWIFAYGSLIFRPDFPWIERRRAFVRGWARRFWQGSPDHRGVPEAPGRVVTLVARDGFCGGCAYRI